MMWNGAFGALLFINDLEYLGSSNTCVSNNTYYCSIQMLP